MILAASVALAAGGRSADRPPPAGRSDWPQPNQNLRSTRSAAGSRIDAGNVTRLRVRWRFAIPGRPTFSGLLASTPLVVGGRVFVQDLNSNVYALDLSTGRLRWTRRYRRVDGGPNGLAAAGGRIFGNTDTSTFALDAASGRQLWSRRLTNPAQPITIAPVVSRDRVYTSTTGQHPGGRGALYALDAASGAVRWRFDTIREPWPFPHEASGGGAWNPVSVDEAGRVYAGTSNPYPWGGSRRHPNGGAYRGAALYTDSLLALEGRSGHLVWYDQATPHDIRDYDFQVSPILATVGGRKLVVGAGKAGRVHAWDRETRRRVWVARVGRHANDLGPTLPTRPVRVCPGLLGGVETPMAYAEGRLFVPLVDLCMRENAYGFPGVGFYALDYSKGRGELVALAAGSGKRLWTRELPSPDFGCATVSRDVVFTATYDGRIYGLNVKHGSLLWQARARAGINACPAVVGSTLLVGAGADHPAFAKPRYELVAYSLPDAAAARTT